MRGTESSDKRKVMAEDYSIPYTETISHNLHGASYFGKYDLSDAFYQFQLDEDAKEIYAINKWQGLFKRCRASSCLEEFFIHVSELHPADSQRIQACGHLSPWRNY